MNIDVIPKIHEISRESLRPYQKKKRFCVKKYKDIAIVSVRGSVSANDIFVNMDMVPQRHDGVSYHRGWLRQSFDLTSNIIDLVSDQKDILFTGHSSGGALATILAYFINKEIEGSCMSVTFASPPLVFTNIDMSNIESEIYVKNYVFDKDPIRFIPFGASPNNCQIIHHDYTKLFPSWDNHSAIKYYNFFRKKKYT